MLLYRYDASMISDQFSSYLRASDRFFVLVVNHTDHRTPYMTEQNVYDRHSVFADDTRPVTKHGKAYNRGKAHISIAM